MQRKIEQYAAFVAGVKLFNEGKYWEAHEAWEAGWLHAQAYEKLMFQGLILLAAALHKRWAHGSLSSQNYAKACAKFAALPPGYGAERGLQLAKLQSEVAAALCQEGLKPQIELSESQSLSAFS